MAESKHNVEETYLWVEKYRPKKLEDVVLSDEYREVFQRFISEGEIPHLLFHGPPGGGKTTIARILISYVIKDPNDLLTINGSTSTGVETIRTLVEDFLKAPSFGGGKCRIVFIDEADYLSSNAQAALRSMMEAYHGTGRFIFTCNYLYKILEPLQSRFQLFEFKRLPMPFVVEYCCNILQSEGIQFSQESVDRVVATFYPDVRKIVNTLQSRVHDGVLEVRNEDIDSPEKRFTHMFEQLCNVLMSTKNGRIDKPVIRGLVNNMLQFLSEHELDYPSVYKDMFDSELVPIWAKIIVNRYANGQMQVMVPSMHLMSCVYTVIDIGAQLVQVEAATVV